MLRACHVGHAPSLLVPFPLLHACAFHCSLGCSSAARLPCASVLRALPPVSLPRPGRAFSTRPSAASKAFLDVLKARGFIQQTSQAIDVAAISALYIGFDPTAPSFHVGHLLPLMALAHASRHHLPAIALIGGASGRIGDPSGKNAERPQLDLAVVEQNSSALMVQLQQLFSRHKLQLVSVKNNLEWFESLSVLDFLRHVGSFARLSDMLARDRLQSQQGLAYHEFSYSLLQAFDFHELYRRYGCNLQMGGSDQWGNMVAGIDLIDKRKSAGLLRMEDQASSFPPPFVVTLPLLTTASGAKFGKSEGNALWLNASLTSRFDLFQYFLQSPDNKVEEYLKLFTFLDLNEINDIMLRHQAQPNLFYAQHILATKVVEFVHSELDAERAAKATKLLFASDPASWTRSDFSFAFEQDPNFFSIPLNRQWSLSELLVKLNRASSLGEVKRLMQAGGVSVNGHKISDFRASLSTLPFIDHSLLVIKTGKSQFTVVLDRSCST